MLTNARFALKLLNDDKRDLKTQSKTNARAFEHATPTVRASLNHDQQRRSRLSSANKQRTAARNKFTKATTAACRNSDAAANATIIQSLESGLASSVARFEAATTQLITLPRNAPCFVTGCNARVRIK